MNSAALIALSLISPRVHAQDTSNRPLPQDVKSISAALDAAIAGRADEDPACLRAVFLLEACFIPVRTDSTGRRFVRIYSAGLAASLAGSQDFPP